MDSHGASVVLSGVSLPFGAGIGLSTSVNSAVKARIAISFCDIFTDVNGGIKNSPRRI